MRFAEAALTSDLLVSLDQGHRFDAAAMFPFSREEGRRGSVHRTVCCLTRECGIPVKVIFLSHCSASYGFPLFLCGLHAHLCIDCSGPEAFCGPQ